MFGFRLAEIHEEKSDLSEILFLNIKKSSMELFVYCFVFSVCFYFFFLMPHSPRCVDSTARK